MEERERERARDEEGGRASKKGRRKNVTVKWLYQYTGKYYNINNYDKNYDNAWGKTIVKTNMYTYINMAQRVRRPSKRADDKV